MSRSAAERQASRRRRQRLGLIHVSVAVDDKVLLALAEAGFLPSRAWDDEDREAIGEAIGQFLRIAAVKV